MRMVGEVRRVDGDDVMKCIRAAFWRMMHVWMWMDCI